MIRRGVCSDAVSFVTVNEIVSIEPSPSTSTFCHASDLSLYRSAASESGRNAYLLAA